MFFKISISARVPAGSAMGAAVISDHIETAEAESLDDPTTADSIVRHAVKVDHCPPPRADGGGAPTLERNAFAAD